MKTTFIAIAAAATILVGCTTAEQDALTGAAVGGVIGGVATGRVGGAVAGAAIGGVAGVLLGRATRRGYCVYRNPRTLRRYTARCPRGYRW